MNSAILSPVGDRIDTNAEILDFVTEMRYVPIEMIYKYFPSKIPETQIKKQLNAVALSRAVLVDWDKGVAYSHDFKFKPNERVADVQLQIIRAGWVLCKWGVEKIRYFKTCEAPLQIVFSTTQGFTCDIAVVNTVNIKPLQADLPRWWKSSIPKGLTDTCTHIAVIPGSKTWKGYDEFMATIRKIGFTLCATIDDKTHDVTMYTIGGKKTE